MELHEKIYVAGHTGLVGSALVRKLKLHGYHNLIMRNQNELDLRNQEATNKFFRDERPAFVFLAAAQVGGIWANMNFPALFIYDNLAIELNVIHAAFNHTVKKLLFFGSSCIYPRLCPQPMREEYLMTGSFEPTNQPYAVAKIAGIELCQAYNKQYGIRFISCMPTNLYGPGDNFDEQHSHVIPGLIARMYRTKIMQQPMVTIWGTGTQLREFLFVDDLADAAIFLMNHYEDSLPINIGVGSDVTIAELAYLIKELINYPGKLFFDTTKPDGAPRKLLNVDRLGTLGWRAQTELAQGIHMTIISYIELLHAAHKPPIQSVDLSCH